MTSKKVSLLLIALILTVGVKVSKAQSASGFTALDHFEKIIISPHIKAVLEKGDQETVLITDQKVSQEKIHIEVDNKTLHIYLEDAKIATKQVKKRENGVKRSVPIYRGTQLTVHITYKTLEGLAIRGEEKVVCEGLLKADEFTLKIYGESSLLVNDMEINELNATFYGESQFTSKKGMAKTQSFKTYGESIIDVRNSENRFTKISSYGSSEFYINAAEKIRIWAFGDTEIHYKGNPEIEKTISIGEIEIQAID